VLNRLADEILASPVFGQALSTAMRRALETKGRVDRNVDALLGLLNLPSRGDLQRLQTKLDVLQGTLTNLSMKVDRLLDARAIGAPDRDAGR
jgi:hypothetical protein